MTVEMVDQLGRWMDGRWNDDAAQCPGDHDRSWRGLPTTCALNLDDAAHLEGARTPRRSRLGEGSYLGDNATWCCIRVSMDVTALDTQQTPRGYNSDV